MVLDLPFDHPQAVQWALQEVRSAAGGYVEAHYDSQGGRRVPRLRLLEQARSGTWHVPAPQQGSKDSAERAGLPPGARASLPATPTTVGEASDEAALGKNDLLLVSGGGKGIAAECALALARNSGVRLLLLGRSLPGEDSELASNLKRLEAYGVEFLYRSADVTDAQALGKALGEAQAEHGPVS